MGENPTEPQAKSPGAGPPKQVQVQLGEKEAEGIYANLVLITHSASEFIFDFARMVPGTAKAKVYSRIIMTPQNAKSLRGVLDRNIENFEKRHGKIQASANQEPSREIGFK